MLTFSANDFCRASSIIGQIFSQIQSGVMPSTDSWGQVASELGMMERACEQLGLNNTLAQIQRIKTIFVEGAKSINYAQLAREVMEVETRLIDELQARTVYVLSAEEAKYLSDHQFSNSAVEFFKQANFDMVEAAKCFALDRPTACVFHLMRVTEYGIHATAKLLMINDPRPNWEPIIKKIDAELKKPYKDRTFKGSGELLANVSTHLHAVKVAWRNRAMHVKKQYTSEEAREIYSATCGLMRYLAENLPRDI